MGRAERAGFAGVPVLTPEAIQAQSGRGAARAIAGMPRTAMVFAAGFGTRMRPITNTLPKPLIAVSGKALIDHSLDCFAGAGLERAIVNVHYRADQIEAHLADRRCPAPAITVSDERALLLDQGGGIRKVLGQFAGEPFFLCNTDAFWLEGSRSNLAALVARWDPAAMDVLLLVADTATSVGVDWPGDFEMGGDGRLRRRADTAVAPFVYTGVGIIKPALFANMLEGPARLAPTFFAAAERGRLHGQRLDGQWLHVGTPGAIAEAEDVIKRWHPG